MINIRNKEQCCGCTACASACPKECIKMTADDEGFLYPVVDSNDCVNCGLCLQVCPFENVKYNFEPFKVYAGYNINIDVKKSSSSGGIFTALAESVIANDGVVFGVVLDDDCRGCHHAMATTLEELVRMRSSKYIQSNMITSYREVKLQLEKGIEVLFSGTPCQINGLRNYLGKDYENLFCLDVICHGVPSALLWSKYVDKFEKKYEKDLKYVNFRAKERGWNNFGSKIKIDSNSIFIPAHEFGYFLFFLYDLCLRPSCYVCKAKKSRSSDITLADYWRVQDIHPELDATDGISAIITRTAKGDSLLHRVDEKVYLVDSSYEGVIAGNSAEYQSVKKPEQRDSFYTNLKVRSISKMEKKYIYTTPKKRVKKFLIDYNFMSLLRKIRGGGGKTVH